MEPLTLGMALASGVFLLVYLRRRRSRLEREDE